MDKTHIYSDEYVVAFLFIKLQFISFEQADINRCIYKAFLTLLSFINKMYLCKKGHII